MYSCKLQFYVNEKLLHITFKLKNLSSPLIPLVRTWHGIWTNAHLLRDELNVGNCTIDITIMIIIFLLLTVCKSFSHRIQIKFEIGVDLMQTSFIH